MDGFRHLFAALTDLRHLVTSEPVPFAARLALAGLLATGGLYKLRHPLIAAIAMVNFRIIRQPRKSAAYPVGTVEILTAGMLLVPWPSVVLAGCSLAGCLCFGFAFLIGRAIRVRDRFPCHCLSGADDEVSVVTLLRAAAMVAAAVVGAAGPFERGVAVPAAEVSVPGIGLAAVMLGVPLALYCAAVARRRYRAFLAVVDWEWVLSQRAGYVATQRLD